MSAARAVRAVHLVILAAVAVAGCGLMPAMGERTWGLASINQLGASQTLTVTDASGVVREVTFDPQDADPFSGPVAVPAAAPDALDVTWSAAACDLETVIRVTARGAGLAVHTVTTMDQAGCDAFGVPRTIRLHLARPVDPAAVTVTQGTP